MLPTLELWRVPRSRDLSFWKSDNMLSTFQSPSFTKLGHDMWIHAPSICNGINLKKIPFASFAIKKLKIEWCQLDTLFWPACSLSDALHRVGQVNLMVSPHCSPRARGFSTRVSFCTTHGFGAAGRQFSVIFPFCLFSHTTCLKRIFRWPTAHGLTLQNPRESKRLFVQGYPFGGSERCSPKF